MKIDIFFLIIIILFVFYSFNQEKETMADTTNIDQIKEAIKQVYLADVESIRNLSEIANKLQADGLTVPGQLKVSGKLSTNNLDPNNMPDGWGGGLRIFDGYASGTIGFGPDGKKLNAYINSNGLISGTNLNVENKIIVNSNIRGPNGQMRLSDQGIMFGGPNNDRETNSGQISAGLHIPNSLNIVGMSADKGHGSRRIDMWAEGGLNVYGQIYSNGIVLEKRNRARFIRVGNKNSDLKQHYWSLIQLRAYDHNGNDVALSKPVSILEGSAMHNTNHENVTKGVVFTPEYSASYDNYYLGFHGNTGISVLQIDLGAEFDLSQIQLFNRYNSGADHYMNGTSIELFGADGQRNRIIHTGIWHRQYSKEFLL